MAISSLPSSGSSIVLQRTITTSGWIDLGDPRLIHFVLAGGGGGGGGGSGSEQGGGGGGGCGGAIAGKLFIGGRVYVQIGAGGTAGAANQTGNNTRAGNGGNSYLGVPYTISNDAAASGMYWIAGIGGMGGANGTTGTAADAEASRISLDATGRPSVTGYTAPNIVSIGSGPGAGGGGGNASSNGNSSSAIGTYYPNVAGGNNSAYSLVLQGWANNDMRWFSSPSGTSVQQTYNGILGINWTDFPMGLFNPGSGSYQTPWTLWTSGNCSSTGPVGGGGGTFANQPVGTNGAGGLFTGSGGGGARAERMSGSGGGGSFYRGGESSRMFGSATNYGGGGGAGILRPGSDGLPGINGSTGGVGGAGGFGGGGGGGGQANTTGAVGGVGGQGALALFW
jgi:hypothetical protein